MPRLPTLQCIELKTIQNNPGLVEHNAACLFTIKVQALVQGQAKQWRRPGHQVKSGEVCTQVCTSMHTRMHEYAHCTSMHTSMHTRMHEYAHCTSMHEYAHKLNGARSCGGRRVQSQFHKAASLWFVSRLIGLCRTLPGTELLAVVSFAKLSLQPLSFCQLSDFAKEFLSEK